jgi:putative FmdB family regulatory protein
VPTYSYTCTVCGHSLDVHQSFDDMPLTVCPECSGRLRKVFSPVGVVFKGSGFYRTDARASGKAGTSSTTAASPAAGTTSTTSTSGTTSTTTSAPTSTSSAPAAKAAAS